MQDNGTTNGAPDFKTGTVYVQVTVTEVNDAPTATDDSKTVAEDGTLSFPASDLTANDSAGPANESGQTLTVTGCRGQRDARLVSRSSPARSRTRRTPTTTARPASTTRSATTARRTAPPIRSSDDGDRRRHRHRGQRRARRRRTTARRSPRTAPQECSSTSSPTTATVRRTRAAQTLTITAVGTPGARHRRDRVRQDQVHADRGRLQRPRLLHVHDHRQRHDRTASTTSSRTRRRSTSPSPRSTTRRRRSTTAPRSPRTANVLVDVLANDSTGPGQRVRPDAHDQRGRHARRTARAVIQSGKVKYTPDADYNGSDSFTYTVDRQRHDQRRQRLQVGHGHGLRHRHRGQRRPVAAADSLTVTEDGVCDRRNGDLTANDSPGPANESGQTLTHHRGRKRDPRQRQPRSA